jgi:hypothetical protein
MSDLDDYVRREVDRMAGAVGRSEALRKVKRRVRRLSRRRAAQRASLVLVVLAGTGFGVFGLVQLFGHPGTPAAGATRMRIGSTTVGGDLRVVLVAERRTASEAATSVLVAISIRQNGGWRLAGQRLVGRSGSWNWNVVTGREGICRLAAEDAPAPRLEVSLPALSDAGCSEPYTFSIEQGRVVPG